MALVISNAVSQKLLKKHGVNRGEIIECFASRERGFLEDSREDHKTDPPTKWFIGETDYGRKLKVVFIQVDNQDIHIKTAYMANTDEIHIYSTYARLI